MPDPQMVTQPEPAGVIADPVALAAKVLDWQQRGFHVLSPAMKIWAFAPGYGVNVSMVLIDATINDDGFGSDTYFDRATMKSDGERAISALGLKRIAQCAGVAWHPELTTRLDDRTIPNLWEYRAVGLVQGIDGTWMSLHGTKEVDFRDGSAQIGGWTPDKWAALQAENRSLPKDKQTWSINGWSEKRVLQARAQGLRLAETKAMSAAIRQLGLKHRYTVQELAQPFVVLRVSYVPDLADPAVREVVMQRALAGTSALYTTASLPAMTRPRPALAAGVVVDFPSAQPEAPAAVPPAAQPLALPAPQPQAVIPAQAPTPAAVSQPAPALAQPAPAVVDGAIVAKRYVKACVIAKQGTNAQGSWTRYAIAFTDGLETSTFSQSIAHAATAAKQAGQPVTITTENKGKYGTELTSLTPADARQPELPVGAGEPALTANDIPF
jgi:hypothetical protein